MMQKLKDLWYVLAGSRKGKVILLIGVIAGLFLLFGGKDHSIRRLPPRPPPKAPKISASTGTDDLLARFNQELETLRTMAKESKEGVEDVRTQMKNYEQRTAEILKKVIDRIEAQNQHRGPAGDGAQGVPEPDDSGYGGVTEDDMERINPTIEEVGPPPAPPVKRTAYVGAGDSVRVKLLAGVNAPTDGTPYPVVFKLVSDVYGPDGSSTPLGEARLVAAAQGSITDARALFRLTSLNILFPNQEKKVYSVDGWIVGEDGIRGMAGQLIDPLGKAIAGAALTGGIGALGSGIASANSTTRRDAEGGFSTEVTGDAAQYAAGIALNGAAKEWSSIIQGRLREYVPVVQVLSGREGTAIFAKSFGVDGLIEAFDAERIGQSSLD